MSLEDKSGDGNILTVNNPGSDFYNYMYDRAFRFSTDANDYINCGGSVNGFDTAMGDCSGIFEITFDKILDGSTGTNYPLISTTRPSGSAVEGFCLRLRDFDNGSAGSDIEWVSYASSTEYYLSTGYLSFPQTIAKRFVGFTISGTTLEVFLDGTSLGTKTIALSGVPDRDLILGLGTNNNSYRGLYHSCALWSSAKTWTEMRALDSANLELWYKMDETSGTTVTDSSGNGNHGTIVNANSSTFFVKSGEIPMMRAALVPETDRQVFMGQSYRAQIYDMSLDIARNRQAIYDLSARLLIDKNDPT